jgi:hypothetical protein
MSTKTGDKTMIQKLRFFEDADKELLEKASSFMLKIKVITRDVIDVLADYGLYNPRLESLCFNFDISLFVDEIEQSHINDKEANKLMRVDWQG